MYYVLSAMVINWPLLGSLTTHISYGHEAEITVPLLNVWTIWWNADRALNGMSGYWNAPIFYPTVGTLIFSEAQPTSLIVAPVLWLTGNRALAYNLYQLTIIALNGFSAHRLLRRLGHTRWLALCGGTMFQILPFMNWQSGVVQLTTLFGIIWTVHSLFDLFTKEPTEAVGIPTRQPASDFSNKWLHPTFAGIAHPISGVGVWLGISYGLTYWLCNYWGLFLTALLIPSSLAFFSNKLWTFAFWRNVFIALIIASLMIGPFAWMQHRLSLEHDWSSARTSEMIEGLSAHWRDHTDSPWLTTTPWLEWPERERENAWALGGGGLKLLLVLPGAFAAWMRPQRRRWGLFVVIFGATALGLSLGPTVRISSWFPVFGGVCPYEFLMTNFPGFSLIRSPFRFALFVQVAAVWMSVEALDLLSPARWFVDPIAEQLQGLAGRFQLTMRQLFNWSDRKTTQAMFVLPLITASLLVTLEVVPQTAELYPIPSHRKLPAWVIWLRDQGEPGAGVACLPFPTGYQVSDYEQTTLWMYWGTFHGRPLLNGYSGFFPATFIAIKEGLEQFQQSNAQEGDAQQAPHFSRYLPDNPGLRLLNETPTRYVVMKRSFGTRDDVWKHPQTRFRWAHVASDELEQIDIYELPTLDDE
ncbi:hypothetical protein [Schlesneria sp. DSM 10557]|uniref:hypothetical protein n=1 Tax=Schlesneria sp. DSM 10557 TaxID=3044399 RepID=UPI00359F1E74